jgi:sensor histidine kinase YesM
VGWQASMVAGYFLFFLYSIALTDLLRREIRRRGWLTDLSLLGFTRLFVSALALGAVQTFLVFAVDIAFQQRFSYLLAHPQYIAPTWISISGADCIWLLFYIALTTRRRYREKEVGLQLALREAELRALEAQINPHFLFNSLNSIRALVIENPPLAQEMITRFATLLRYNLRRDLDHTVPLSTEVEIVSDYLAIEGVRFEDRLRVDIAIAPEAAPVAVPPMLLQALVENAIKHGIANLPEGGDVKVRAALDSGSLRLEVENTGRLTEPKPGATCVGLSNTRQRLRILYDGRATLDLRNGEGRVTATVVIPQKP